MMELILHEFSLAKFGRKRAIEECSGYVQFRKYVNLNSKFTLYRAIG
jgi:hypothetical protein